MKINGYRTIIEFDPRIDMFRGNLSARIAALTFDATELDNLKHIAPHRCRYTLTCAMKGGVEPVQTFSGELIPRFSPRLDTNIADVPAAHGKNLTMDQRRTRCRVC